MATTSATGVYFDTTCGNDGTVLPVLNSLSVTGTGFTENMSPPCGGSVQLIASNPAFAGVTDEDIQGWFCSVHTTYPTYPTDWQPLAVATDTPTQPTCGTDPITHDTACGEAYVLVAGEGIVVVAPNLALTPATDSAVSGGTHTVTASVTQSGAPLSSQPVSFLVTGQNAGAAGTCAPVSCATDATGKVTFTYSDGNGVGADTINASVTIAGSTQHATATMAWTAAPPVNHAPVATDSSVITPQDVAVAAPLGATDADGDALAYTVVSGPSHGSLSGTAPNLTYTPAAGYSGSDSFTFKANDGKVDSNTATVSITVTPAPPVNHTPVATDGSATTDQETAVATPLAASDLDGDALSFTVVSGPSHGTLSGTAPNLTYTPAAGFSGSDSFTFRANDGKADSNVATVRITVNRVTKPCTGPNVDAVVSGDQGKAGSAIVSPGLTTTQAGDLLVAYVAADGPNAPTQKVTTVTGGGVTWTLVARSNSTWGTTEVWQAHAPGTLAAPR